MGTTLKSQRRNQHSSHLSQDENEMVFSFLERRCQAMNTSVVQLFTTNSPHHSKWIKRITGVACFVRDSSKRSYFIRVYCLARHELYWQEELYRTISVKKPSNFLITFEGKNSMIALNFAFEDEANKFHKTVTEVIEKNCSERRRSKILPAINGNIQQLYPVQNVSNVMQNRAQIQSSPIDTKISQVGKKLKRRINKADISLPTNFVHVDHIGWSGPMHIDNENANRSQNSMSLDRKVLNIRSDPLTPHLPPRSPYQLTKSKEFRQAQVVRDWKIIPTQNPMTSSSTPPPPPPPPPPSTIPPPPPLPPASPPLSTMPTVSNKFNTLDRIEKDPRQKLMDEITRRNQRSPAEKSEACTESAAIKRIPIKEKPAPACDGLGEILKKRVIRTNYSDDEQSSDSDKWSD